MLKESDRELFSSALAELGVSLHKAHVGGHNNTLQAFYEEWGKPKRVFRASNGVEVHVLEGLRKRKHTPTSNVYAADFGDERAFHVVLRNRKAA